MTDKQKKKPGRDIGGIRQFATFGGDDEETTEPSGTQTSSSSSTQTTKRSDAQVTRRSSAQELKRSDAQTTKSLVAQAPSSPGTQAHNEPKWKRQTVYLYPDLYRWVRHYIADTDQDISNVVNEALRQYRAKLEE